MRSSREMTKVSPFSKELEAGLEFLPAFGLLSRLLLSKDPGATERLQLVVLDIQTLAGAADSCVSNALFRPNRIDARSLTASCGSLGQACDFLFFYLN